MTAGRGMTAISKLSERFTESVTDDEIVIMRVDNGEFFSLAGTAAAAWRLIDGDRDKAAVVAALAQEFTTDEKEIAPEVDEFLLRLRDSGLLAEG